ncbi:hypothetical protein Bbelb_158520 [Branchiostoma belcheri]|nr:hypothetical protein Bbelb_158520 [Branchiostoma belcheri]
MGNRCGGDGTISTETRPVSTQVLRNRCDVSSRCIKTGAEETVQSLQKRGLYPHKSYVTDVTSADAVSKLVESVRADYSVVPDVVLASQGVQTHTAFLDMDEETFDRIVNVSLKTCVAVTV